MPPVKKKVRRMCHVGKMKAKVLITNNLNCTVTKKLKLYWFFMIFWCNWGWSVSRGNCLLSRNWSTSDLFSVSLCILPVFSTGKEVMFETDVKCCKQMLNVAFEVLLMQHFWDFTRFFCFLAKKAFYKSINSTIFFF